MDNIINLKVVEADIYSVHDSDSVFVRVTLCDKCVDSTIKKVSMEDNFNNSTTTTTTTQPITPPHSKNNVAWGEKFELKTEENPSENIVIQLFKLSKSPDNVPKLIGECAFPLQEILDAEMQEYDHILELQKAGKTSAKIHIEAHVKGARRVSLQILTTSVQKTLEKKKDKSSKEKGEKVPSLSSTQKLEKTSIYLTSPTSSYGNNSGGGATYSGSINTPLSPVDKEKLKAPLSSRGTKSPSREKKKTLNERTYSKTRGDKPSKKRPTTGDINKVSSILEIPTVSSAPSILVDGSDGATPEAPTTESVETCIQKIGLGEISVNLLSETKRVLLGEGAVADFLDKGGFSLLVPNLINAKFKPNSEPIQTFILDILIENISDKNVLMKVVVDSPNTLKTIIFSADSEFTTVKTRAYRFFSDLPAIIAKFEESSGFNVHGNFVEAFDYYNCQTTEEQRFQHLVQGLKHDENLHERVAILKIINIILSFPDDNEERMSLRGEFIGLGLENVLEDLKKTPEGEDSDPMILEQIQNYENYRAGDEQIYKSYLSALIQYNMDWHDNKTLALLCSSLLQRVTKNDWLRRVFFETAERLVCLQTDQKIGLAKWFLLQKIVLQLSSQGKDKVIFNKNTSVDLEKLITSILESDFTSSSSIKNITDETTPSEQLKYKYKRLESELLQAKENLETLRLDKEAEIEDLQKQLQQQQPSATGSGGDTQDETKYDELQVRRALERKELQNEKHLLDEEKTKLNKERERIRELIEQLKRGEAVPPQLFIEESSNIASSWKESVEAKRHKQEEEDYANYVDVVKQWLEDVLQIKIDLSKQNLHQYLIDGCLLCKAMSAIKPGSIRKFYPSSKVTMLRIENIGFFLNACETEFGFSPFHLFSASDLIDGQNMKKVLNVLIEIIKKSSIRDINGDDNNNNDNTPIFQ